MPKPSILHLKYSDEYPDYVIPEKFRGRMIFISTRTTLKKNGWDLDLRHSVDINGDPIPNETGNKAPDLDRTLLGSYSDLNNKELTLLSIALRLDGSGEVPDVHYTVLLEAGNEEIDSFEIDGSANPAHFYTQATIRTGS